jgi:hypothetical protein
VERNIPHTQDFLQKFWFKGWKVKDGGIGSQGLEKAFPKLGVFTASGVISTRELGRFPAHITGTECWSPFLPPIFATNYANLY